MMGYGSQIALFVLLLGLNCGESIDGGARLTRGRSEATSSTLERASRSRSSSSSVGRWVSPTLLPRRLLTSSLALRTGTDAFLLLRGGSDTTNAENAIEPDVEGKVESPPDRDEGTATPHDDAANNLEGKPRIETMYMQSGEESEVAASRNQESVPVYESLETRRPQQPQQEESDRRQPPGAGGGPRIDKVVLPSDSSFVQSPAQLRAFVKRRGPQQGGSAGAAPPQQKSQASATAEDGSSATASTPMEVESTPAASESRAVSGHATKPVRSLVAPVVHLFALFFRGLSHPALLCYGAAMVGTSVGFAQFLYFSTVGYASGIALPVGMNMLLHRSKAPIRSASNLSSLLVLLWGIRLAAFLLWREYLNWPALHAHMQHVKPPPLVPTQLLGWVVYSGLYLCVASPVLFQRQPTRNATSTASLSSGEGSTSSFHRPSKVALALQIAGLLLEATADVQKSLFKAQYRHDWCNVGLWKYSTHPNYLGEAMFWVGTHLGGLSNLIRSRHGRSLLGVLVQLATSGAGLAFVLSVLHGAITHSRGTQFRKYGTDPSFIAFQDTYGLFGYRLWKHLIRPALRRAMASPMMEALDETA